MIVYIVAYEDYDGSGEVGYFTDESKAEECCKYLNRTKPSWYYKDDDLDTWRVCEYELDETDYASLNRELDEQDKIKLKEKTEKEKQEVLAEIARLEERYKSLVKG